MKIIPTEVTYNSMFLDGGRDGITLKAYVPYEELNGMIDISKPLHISEYDHPKAAIVKCSYCGQWAAARTACKHCGAPVG
jgi:hypothetical protein